MTTIPRRLVYRVLAQVVHGQARAIAGRTAGRTLKRRPEAHQGDAAVRQEDRHDHAHDLRVQADELTRRIGDPAHYHGAGVDPALLGWLAVLALGHTEARAEIARIAGPGTTDGVDWLDMPLVVDRLLTPH